MNIKLLFVAALTFSGSVFAQELRGVKTVNSGAVRLATPISRNYEARATIFSQVFNGPGLGLFTESHGATSTAPHWAYDVDAGGATCLVTTNAQAASTFDEYLTVTNAIAIPDPLVDGDVYRLQVDMGVDYGWLNTARGGGGNLKIQLSNDNGATWTDFWFEENLTMLRNTFTSFLPNTEGIVDISPIINIPNSYRVADFKFRISLTGSNTADQTVYGASVYSVPVDFSYVRTNFLYHGDIVNDFEYARIPLSQVKPLVATMISTNEGLVAANRDVTFIVRRGNTEVHSEDITIAYPLLKCDSTFHELAYTPDVIGNYTLVAVSRGGETVVRDSVTFEITEFAYSHGNLNNLQYAVNRDGEVGYVSQFRIENTVPIYGANVYLYSGTTVGQNVDIFLLKFNGTSFSTEYEGSFSVATANLNASVNPAGLRVLYIPFEYFVEVEPGDIVRLEVRKSNGNALRVLASPGNPDDGTLMYGDFGSAGVAYYGGYDYSFALELNFKNDVSIQKVEGMENVTVYPNPTNGVVNISNTDNDVLTVSVKDITGKEVAATSVFGNGTIDLGSFGAGVYVLEMTNGTSRAAQRVIVK